jgi:hypothetical protein
VVGYNEVSIAKAHWNAILVYDTKVFNSYLDQISVKIKSVNDTLKAVKSHYSTMTDKDNFTQYLQALNEVQLDINALKDTYDNIIIVFRNKTNC